jgi:hypothetical protein
MRTSILPLPRFSATLLHVIRINIGFKYRKLKLDSINLTIANLVYSNNYEGLYTCMYMEVYINYVALACSYVAKTLPACSYNTLYNWSEASWKSSKSCIEIFRWKAILINMHKVYLYYNIEPGGVYTGNNKTKKNENP